MNDLNALVVQAALLHGGADFRFIADQKEVSNGGVFGQRESGTVHDHIRAAVAAHDIDDDAHK
jgi:hypothetical protein